MKAWLFLEDGMRYEGVHFGFIGRASGEIVFTTGMTGYPESLTDPSFAGQILVMTYPLIGNYGVPKRTYVQKDIVANFESKTIWVNGVVIADLCEIPSHIKSNESFDAWLTRNKISALMGIDTRALTQHIREKGTMKSIISTDSSKPKFSPRESEELVAMVSSKTVTTYKPFKKRSKRIALIDCGVKHGILRTLLELGHEVTRVPWNINPLDIGSFDGVVASNGPGDPKQCEVTVAHIRKILTKNIPFLGICLGHQLMSLAVGADTYKLPYGHRGLNQPCQDMTRGKAYITSQNHGYAVNPKTLPKAYTEWFINLNDGTNEGIRHRGKRIASVQFHPEGSPGPFDTVKLFRIFD
ncbi:glutamine-hydrolyzing carbamoyl-phosphate synthase small subunit [Candidatus Gottesmanbacteria bacterium]|nr:glutamine-hydrolyzing carbamoyl-phosphate synthase small subunit [Candidatus Gottesmanbacteria bacterium]